MNLVSFLFAGKEDSGAPFVVSREKQVSFASLYEATGRLAVLACAFGQGERMLLVSENSRFWIAAYLAIIGSGNVCVPLNPRLSPASLKEIATRVSAAAVFAESRVLPLFEGTSLPLISESGIDCAVMEGKEEWPRRVKPEAPAVIIFTSGSSGRAKGVELSHKNIISNTESILAYLELTPADRTEVVLPFYYCYGTSLLHTHLRAGGSLVLNNRFIYLNTVLEDLESMECTGFAGVPSHYELLMTKTEFLAKRFPKLRYMTQAGGKLGDRSILKIWQSHPEVRFFVMYGQTEATARLSYLPPEKLPDKVGSIGRGIPGVVLRVVDEQGVDVAVGARGEVIAQGANIMSGYFEDPDGTAAVLRGGWLYTGDMATVDEEGYIYLQGRTDGLVKVGGFRVNIAEVEAKLSAVEGLTRVCVVPREDELLGTRLVAVCEARHMSAEDIEVLAREVLLSHEIPQKILVVESMPLTSSGKAAREEIEALVGDG